MVRPRSRQGVSTHGRNLEVLPRVSALFENDVGKRIEKICKIAERDQKRLRQEDTTAVTTSLQNLTIATSGLHRLYEGPGQNRHDNDYEFIKDISIVPTHQELLSEKVCHSPLSSDQHI